MMLITSRIMFPALTINLSSFCYYLLFNQSSFHYKYKRLWDIKESCWYYFRLTRSSVHSTRIVFLQHYQRRIDQYRLLLLPEVHIQIILDFPALVGVGVAAFVSTPRFSPFQIVLGQYIGMGSLIGVSLAGSLITFILPRNLIGLIGLFPISIGIKELLELRKKGDEEDEKLPKNSYKARKYNCLS